MLLSLTKVNLWYKNGFVIPKSSNIICHFRKPWNVRNINKIVYFKITNIVKTITEGNLILTHNRSIPQKIINDKRVNPKNDVQSN